MCISMCAEPLDTKELLWGPHGVLRACQNSRTYAVCASGVREYLSRALPIAHLGPVQGPGPVYQDEGFTAPMFS